MKVQKVQRVEYASHVRGKIEQHSAAFLTRSHTVTLMGPFLNARYAQNVATSIMKGKESSLTVLPLIVAVVWEREKYDKRLVGLAKAGEFVVAYVIENTPDDIEAIQAFALQLVPDQSLPAQP